MVGHFKIVLALHTMMGSYKDNFVVKRMDNNMLACVWSTGVNAATNRLHFNTLFELAATVASDTAHLPMLKLFEPLTDRAKFKFVLSKLPKKPAQNKTWFEENVDKCHNLNAMFKFFTFEEGRTGSMPSDAKGCGMLSNLNVNDTPSRFDGSYDGELVELVILQCESVLNNTWIQATQECNDGHPALWDTLIHTLTGYWPLDALAPHVPHLAQLAARQRGRMRGGRLRCFCCGSMEHDFQSSLCTARPSQNELDGLPASTWRGEWVCPQVQANMGVRNPSQLPYGPPGR